MVIPNRGGKKLFIISLNSKRYKVFDFSTIKNEDLYNEGIYNAGFLNNENIIIIYRNELYGININTNKIIFKKDLPKGYYSSYNKKLRTIITKNDTLIVSQLYSKKASEYSSESDGIYDISPISVFSFRKNTFKSIYLPENSKFKTKNFGQPIVDFTVKDKSVFFHVSPENKFYSFNIDKENFKLSKVTSYDYTFLNNDTLIGSEKSVFLKDLVRLTTLNPILWELEFSKNDLIINYCESMNDEIYRNLLSPNFSKKERMNYYDKHKKSYAFRIDLENKTIKDSTLLGRGIESIALKISDSLYVLKPRVAYFEEKGYIPIYLAIIK